MSDVSAVTNLLVKANEGFISTLGSTIATSATVVPLTSVTGLTDGSTFVGIIEPGATAQQVFTGVVDVSGSRITGVKWTRGTNVGHAGGVSIVDYVSGTAINMLSKAIGVQHNNDGTHSTAFVTSVLSSIYPVGCIYIETSGTNPATTFGFGTWTSFGAGRTLVGVGTSDQAFAAGATGGESTHVLTIPEMPSHTHNRGPSGTSGSFGLIDGAAASSSGNAPTSSTGGGGAHNNLQPYVVVYFWKRTV